jgi:hypothetical protein
MYHRQLGAPVSPEKAGVASLQSELRKLAVETRRHDIDPARYDGTMDIGTLIALGNAAPVLGKALHPALETALSVVKAIKYPFTKIPYGETVIDIVLSPWLIDEVFSAVLAIIRLFPGGGSAAEGIKTAVDVGKHSVGLAAGPLALVIRGAREKGLSDWDADWGLGDDVPPAQPTPPPSTTAPPPAQPPRAPVPGAPPPPKALPVCPTGERWDATAQRCVAVRYVPLPVPLCPVGSTWDYNGKRCVVLPPGTTPGQVRDHRGWVRGRKIEPKDWGGAMQFMGKATLDDLHPIDREAYVKKAKAITLVVLGGRRITIPRSAYAFFSFVGFDGAKMRAFFDEGKGELRIVTALVRKTRTKYPWDYASDAIAEAADYVADIAEDAWDYVYENADDVYAAIRKYGCAIVNNDLIVAGAAVGAGFVASPATSAAIVSGAGAGRGACAILDIGEALFAVIKFLSMERPPPPSFPGEVAGQAQRPVISPPPEIRRIKRRVLPAGSIQSFDARRGLWLIAVPTK